MTESEERVIKVGWIKVSCKSFNTYIILDFIIINQLMANLIKILTYLTISTLNMGYEMDL